LLFRPRKVTNPNTLRRVGVLGAAVGALDFILGVALGHKPTLPLQQGWVTRQEVPTLLRWCPQSAKKRDGSFTWSAPVVDRFPFSDYSSLRCSLSRINLSAHPRPISRRLRPFHGRLHQPP